VNEDDEWALLRLLAEPVLEECAARRAVVDRITHRVVFERASDQASFGWTTLCGHRLRRKRPHAESDFSDGPVDCMACITAGG
jgi:hypothetical protein